ncbi:MAG: TorF family putative porin [Pseudomonadaceae bacterium]|nr:TorF family putative porin [Pseudomonadaceae bacterium]
MGLIKKVMIIAVALGGLAFSGTTAAAAEVSGNVTFATDYRFRGISQGDRSMAVQGGFDVAWDNGFYAGTWASNVTFSGAAIETDLYFGYGGSFNDDISYDVGYIYYAYPEDDSDPDLDYQEIYGSLSFNIATVGFAYSNDYFAETDTFIYLYGGVSVPLGENFSLDANIGLNMFDSDEAFASFIGPAMGEDPGDDYIDYSIGVSTSAGGLDFGAAFIGTDLDEDECFGGSKLCDDTIVLSVSKSL